MIVAARHFIYRGGGREAIPYDSTHVRVHDSITAIPARAFQRHRNIVELICHPGVKRIENEAFVRCSSFKRVIMPGVEMVQNGAFSYCESLTEIECDALEGIGSFAFSFCSSLRSINLQSVKFVNAGAFVYCKQLKDVVFSGNLESIQRGGILWM